MPVLSRRSRSLIGARAAASHMYRQDKAWSRYSNDKVDIAHTLTRVIRTLHKGAPLDRPLAALSVGSSNEPQFRILESAFRAGLSLMDIEDAALRVVAERVRRQRTRRVRLIKGDYRRALRNRAAAARFRARHLSGRRVELVAMHHSLYYAPREAWSALTGGVFTELLRRPSGGGAASALHAVLMSSRDEDPRSTTWLYNHFAGTYFGATNDQDLGLFARELRADRRFAGSRVLCRPGTVRFFAPDFEQFMGVVWMILLHPAVHRFSKDQQREVTEHVYQRHFRPGKPLVQTQDHLVVYRGGSEGLI